MIARGVGYNPAMPTQRRSRLGGQLPRMRVAPPGPESRRLAATLARHESPGVSTMAAGLTPIVWREAKGANVVDADGNVYIDLTGGFGVANLGHAHPRVTAAVSRQSSRLMHALGDVHPSDVRVELAERLARLAPVEDGRVMFATSGAEAVELALKSATRFTGRTGFVAFEGGFHGQSYGALSVTHREAFREAFLPQLHRGVARVPFPYAYRHPGGEEACAAESLAAVEQALRSPPEDVGPIAGVIVEPAQGREGEIVPPPDFLPALHGLCRRYGALLIADEMITGFGRTGRWFAVDHWGVRPDVICLGKAMAGGMPISACVARREVMESWRYESGEAPHSSTFMGHPPSCAAALASIDEMARRRLPERAARLGAYVLERLRALQEGRPAIGDVRGLGLMVGVEVVRDAGSREPAPGAAAEVARACLEQGVIVLAGGMGGNVLSLTPPLTITRRQLDYALRVLTSAFPTHPPT